MAFDSVSRIIKLPGQHARGSPGSSSPCEPAFSSSSKNG